MTSRRKQRWKWRENSTPIRCSRRANASRLFLIPRSCTRCAVTFRKRAIESLESLVDVDYALQFPKMQYDANKVPLPSSFHSQIAESVFTRLSQCNTLSCNTLSFSEKVAAINILNRLHDFLNTATKTQIKPFTGYAKTLLSSVVSKESISSSLLTPSSVTDKAFLAFSDLTLFVATHSTLSAADAQALAARFLSLHTTSRPDVAFALLRVLSVLRPALGDSAVSLRGDYVDGKVRVTVTDVLAQPRSDVIVLMREGTEEPLRLAFEKDAFVAATSLSQGVHSFVVKVGVGEGLEGRCRVWSVSCWRRRNWIFWRR